MAQPESVATAAVEWDATTYDRIADPMTRWGAAVLDRLRLAGDECVLDAGCGSGRVTEQLCRRLPQGGSSPSIDPQPWSQRRSAGLRPMPSG